MSEWRVQAKTFVLGITGASGAIYAVRMLEVLLSAGHQVHVSISPAGQQVLWEEIGLKLDLENFEAAALLPDPSTLPAESKLAALQSYRGQLAKRTDWTANLSYHHYKDFFAPIASGSFLTDAMVICPASDGTVSAVAHGTSENLICRAADVHLKERRKLILVPRETPLSLVHLENMQRCTLAGAVILPAMPGFYHGVSGIADLVDFVVARICDQLGVGQELMQRWGR